jgi:signal transduction histidine kinase
VAARAARLTGGIAASAVVLAAGGAIGARAVGAADADQRREAARRSAAASTRAFDAAAGGVRHSLDTLALLAPAVARTPDTPPAAVSAALSPGGVTGLVVVPVKGTAVLSTGSVPAGTDVAGVAEAMRPAFELARDTGDPHGAVVGGAVGIAIAVYGSDVISTVQRRGALTGWVVALVDPAALVAHVASASDHAVLRVGGAVVAGRGGRGELAAESTRDVAGQPWQLVVTPDPVGSTFPFAWPVFFFGLIGAAGAVFVGRRGNKALAVITASTDALERETRTIAELGPLLQQSLDLAEVLPAVAVRLSDEFGLDAFAVELLGEHGELVDVFAVGRRTAGADATIVGSDGIAAGSSVAMPLLRAGRTIGRLRMVPRGYLAPAQVDALRGAADLIAVATYNVELYEREQATVRRLQELDRLKDAFLGTISHELRTPITAISGFARMLNDRWDDLTEEQRRDFLRRVGRNSASLGLLVDDLLDFARLERQALSTNPTPIALDVVVETFVNQVVPALGEHPVETDLAPDVLAMADPRAIERVLANLLTNAAKFSPAGSPVEVGLRTDGDAAVVTVADHGPGIAEEDRLRVFTRFYRGESNAARSTRGAGIGLAVVHELVTQMGGEIEVREREPHGTVMVIRLPLATSPATAPAPPPRPSLEDRIPARSTP